MVQWLGLGTVTVPLVTSVVSELCATLWTVACQAPLFMELSGLEYWNELPVPISGDLSNPGIEPLSLESPALTGGFFTHGATWRAGHYCGPGSTPDQGAIL